MIIFIIVIIYLFIMKNPIIIYTNLSEKDTKKLISKENKGKVGIYKFVLLLGIYNCKVVFFLYYYMLRYI